MVRKIQATRRIENEIVRRLKGTAIAFGVERLNAAGAKIDRLKSASDVVPSGAAERQVAVISGLPIESAVIACVKSAVGAERCAVQ